MFHEHPLRIVKYASKNIWLLIFPLLRGLKNTRLDINMLYGWAKGAWFDILVIIFIIGYGYVRWVYTWYRFGEDEINLMSGIFMKKETSIPYKNVSTFTSEQSFYLRPFKASRLNIDTCAGTFNIADMSLLIRREDMKKLHRKIPEIIEKGENKKIFSFKPKWWSIIFFSFVFSSSLSGVVYIAALLFQSGRLAGEFIENEFKYAINEITNEVSGKLALGIPPMVITISILIIATWLFSFILNMLRYTGFSMKNDNNILKIKTGYITRRHYYIVPEKVNYIDLRQNFLMKIFNVTSVNISCSGYGHKKNELPVLLPILNKKQAIKALDIFNIGKFVNGRNIKALKKATLNYIWIPLYSLIAIPILMRILIHFLPMFSQMILFIGFMSTIPLIWLLIVKIFAMFTSGASLKNDMCCIRYCRFFSFHTVVAHKNKLVKAQILQSPFQRILNRCSIAFYFNSEVSKKNLLKGVSLIDAEKFLKKLNMEAK